MCAQNTLTVFLMPQSPCLLLFNPPPPSSFLLLTLPQHAGSNHVRLLHRRRGACVAVEETAQLQLGQQFWGHQVHSALYFQAKSCYKSNDDISDAQHLASRLEKVNLLFCFMSICRLVSFWREVDAGHVCNGALTNP